MHSRQIPLIAAATSLVVLLAAVLAPAARIPANANNNSGNNNTGNNTTGNNNNTNNKKPAAPPPPPTVIKYEGKQQENYNGKQMLALYGINLISGQEMKWWVPPADPKEKTYTPKPEIMDYVDQLKAGDYAKLEMHSQYNVNWVERIDFYKMAAGEELPGNFIFYNTIEDRQNDQHVQVVHLQKFGQTVDAVLPMKSVNKAMVADPAMLATVNSLTKGDVVSVEVAGGDPPVLKSIDPYKAPVQAKLGKVVQADVTDSLKGPAIELDEDGSSVTLPIRGQVVNKKWVADSTLLSRLKNLKPGTAVLVTTHDQDGKTWLKDVKLAPVQPAAAGKSGTGKFDK